MRQLIGDNTFENTILKQLFLQRILTNIQLILASTKEAVDIKQLAELTNKIVEVSSPLSSTTHIVAVLEPLEQLSPQPDQVHSLTRQVQALMTQLQVERERSTSFERSPSRSQSR